MNAADLIDRAESNAEPTRELGWQLADEIRRLERALQQIAELDSTRSVWEARGIALAALKGQPIVIKHREIEA